MAYLRIPDFTQTMEMLVIVNIASEQSHYNAYTIIILLFFVWSVIGPMTRPGARGLGPGLGLKYDNCVAGRAWTYFLRAGPGPGLLIRFVGRARAGSAPLLRARASSHICGPGLGLNFRPVQDPSVNLPIVGAHCWTPLEQPICYQS